MEFLFILNLGVSLLHLIHMLPNAVMIKRENKDRQPLSNGFSSQLKSMCRLVAVICGLWCDGSARC